MEEPKKKAQKKAETLSGKFKKQNAGKFVSIEVKSPSRVVTFDGTMCRLEDLEANKTLASGRVSRNQFDKIIEKI